MSNLDHPRAVRFGDIVPLSSNLRPAVDLFGVPVDAATLEQALDRVHDAIDRREPLHIGVVNAAKIVNMRNCSQLRKSVLQSDVIYADGMSVVWASRILGRPLPERIAGIDLMYGILRRGQTHAYRIYCLGARPETVEAAIGRFEEDFPGVNIVGWADGYFDEAGEERVARAIREAQPDVLFVAITSPKKENFMARWSEYMRVPVVHGVGGSFDVAAGLVQRAPESWQRLGFEWLYRLKQEPLRLFKRYFVTNAQFLAMLIREMLRDTPVSR